MWDYPRPPVVVPDERRVRVLVDGVTVADTTAAVRVLETSHPPTFYLPAVDVRSELLEPEPGRTGCEWKGLAHHFNLRVGERVLPRAAWTYPDPRPGYEQLTDRVAFYPRGVEAWVGEHRVEAQPGDFYGGWITPEVTGPFKGGPGTRGW